ncbi:hypothetical protein EAO71_26960 [Streptomyces sp. ms191]|uniref:hypothetical protein n=1 Tax=Streptomyces sp. ms191 TaxID=1827978 RepID=UPI0011CEAFD0|nr:hypothetical protein [Streptomyces sp. ms191]TXS21747.1 hypothetical protein EAO71_26960 [Streptomyces sp. ms191]
MARENRDQWTEGRTEGGSDNDPAIPAVPAQRAGRTAPPAPSVPPPAPPVTPPAAGTPASPLSKSPQSAAPSDAPSATGRNGGSRKETPAETPAAPRGRTATDRPAPEGQAPEPGRVAPGEGRGDHHAAGTGPTADLEGTGPAGALLGDRDRERLGQRLHHALAGFVDSPRDAVAKAADVLDETEEQLIASLKDRRTALRAGWQQGGDARDRGADTEQLRLTLRTYREVTERLLGA